MNLLTMGWLSSIIGSQPSQLDDVQEDNSAKHNDVADQETTTELQRNAEDQKATAAVDKPHIKSLNSDETQQMIARMDTKLAAISRATLQLSDNSYYLLNTPDNASDEINLTEKAPVGWKQQYNELFALLRTGLLGFRYDDAIESHEPDNERGRQTNVSAILMGPRGQGKSFILERCLSDLSVLAGQLKKKKCVDERANERAAFRVVRLNGLLYAGQNAVACAREIARQIGEMAGETKNVKQSYGVCSSSSSKKKLKLNDGLAKKRSDGLAVEGESPNNNDNESPTKAFNFTTRRSGFTSNIALLDEALQTARIDNIPILIILEELDTFISKGKSMNSSEEAEESSARQLLLYHLLDRVADCKFLVSLVGLTTDISTSSKLEKRVLSRAEGTSKFIYFGRMLTYNDCIEGVLMPFHVQFNSSDSSNAVAMLALRKEVEFILRGGDNYRKGDEDVNDCALIRRVLENSLEVRGIDMRWFCRVLDVALGLLAADIEDRKHEYIQRSCVNVEERVSASKIDIRLMPCHLAMALSAMGAYACNIVRANGHGPSTDSLVLSRWERLSKGPYRGNDLRIRALFDLAGPQVTILLAARRIMSRDDTRSTIEDEVDCARKQGVNKKTMITMASPVTYQRILDEYTTTFVASGRYTISSDRYPPHLLYRALTDLIELNLIRLKKDHSGRGPLQYEHCDSLSSGAIITNLPLHINIDMDEEFLGLLKGGILHCSTALREWGLKIS